MLRGFMCLLLGPCGPCGPPCCPPPCYPPQACCYAQAPAPCCSGPQCLPLNPGRYDETMYPAIAPDGRPFLIPETRLRERMLAPLAVPAKPETTAEPTAYRAAWHPTVYRVGYRPQPQPTR